MGCKNYNKLFLNIFNKKYFLGNKKNTRTQHGMVGYGLQPKRHGTLEPLLLKFILARQFESKVGRIHT